MLICEFVFVLSLILFGMDIDFSMRDTCESVACSVSTADWMCECTGVTITGGIGSTTLANGSNKLALALITEDVELFMLGKL